MTHLLIIDDDRLFCEVLDAAFTRRGFSVTHAQDSTRALALAAEHGPEYILLDLKLAAESGLAITPKLLASDPFARIVILTGYASVATAVEAIKLGAVHYLAKPASVEAILDAFTRQGGDPNVPVADPPQSVLDVEWEHIRRALARNDGNISATARELRMHRRTLQRKLDKMPENR